MRRAFVIIGVFLLRAVKLFASPMIQLEENERRRKQTDRGTTLMNRRLTSVSIILIGGTVICRLIQLEYVSRGIEKR